MDVWQAIKQDHDKVDGLLRQLSAGGADGQQLFRQVKQELTAHNEGEERAVYPVLQQHDQTKDLVQHSLKEHQEVDHLLQEMQKMSPDDAGWTDKLQQLKDSVKHHVQEEEQKVIPAAQTVISADEAQEMLRGFQQAKQSATA